ncbi:MAG: ABC transporter substrate-binding protein [Bythopirellula sp.]
MARRLDKQRVPCSADLAGSHLLVLVSLAAALILISSDVLVAAAEQAEPARRTRLLDQPPFDRITLTDALGKQTIDTQLLDLPNRRLPDPLPRDGSIQLRRLSDPSVLYNLTWSSIARIELYEQLLLQEASRLVAAKNLPEAYEYLSFLHQNYPGLAELPATTETYLRQDALASYREKRYEETFTILLALYEANPRHRGLKKFVETVTDRLISKHLAERDFAAARSVLDTLSSSFPQLQLGNIRSWRDKFEVGADRQLQSARKAVDQGQFLEARRALRRALAILPSTEGAQALLNQIDRQSPQLLVGVYQLALPPASALELPAARVDQLTDPTLLQLTGFGAEGGKYQCSWADLTSDDTGLEFDFKLNDVALKQGFAAENLALALMQQADPAELQYRADFARLIDEVEINQGNLINIRWRRSHVRPEALLALTLENVMQIANPPGAYQVAIDREEAQTVTYQLPKGAATNRGPETIIEKYYDNEDLAFADLLGGELDVVATVPPWQLSRFQQVEGVSVSPYRLPTIHVLIPNYEKPIMRRREFRRAICYGIDRPQILQDILLGGQRRPGFRVLSGPLPAGVTLTDPVGYAYNQGLQPRSYEPRLAAVLATVARKALAKLEAASNPTPPAEEQGDAASAEQPDAPPQPLGLVHPPSPVATLACQSLKLQLNAVGIPVKLVPLTPGVELADTNYDIRYAELAMWEPIVAARRLLGPNGVAGNCSSSMSLALSDVDLADNWKEARTRLQTVHQIAFNDLQVIPLWQTVDFFAHRESLSGIGRTPVTLYQNVADWQRVVRGGGR